MKEYGIYIRHGNSKPFMIHIFNNLDSAKLKLFEILNLDDERNRPYFVDNDFFNNKYHFESKLSYYCIKVRDVSDWTLFSEKELIENDNHNLIFFKNHLTN